ncbi:hypothetical protein ADK43_17275, partial [Streptomyces rimosus subsp. rimosus]
MWEKSFQGPGGAVSSPCGAGSRGCCRRARVSRADQGGGWSGAALAPRAQAATAVRARVSPRLGLLPLAAGDAGYDAVAAVSEPTGEHPGWKARAMGI